MEIGSEPNISVIPLTSIIPPIPKKNLRLKGHDPRKKIVSNELQIFLIDDPGRDLNIYFVILL